MTDLGDAIVNSTGLFELSLPARSLPYGMYKIEVNVSMVDEPAIDNAISVPVLIVPSPLIGELNGGPLRYAKFNKNQTFDAGEFTYDPDLDDPMNKTGMTFQWLCKRSCETWPVFDSQYNIIDTTHTSTCVDTIGHGILGNRGCLSNVEHSYPGILCFNMKCAFTYNISVHYMQYQCPLHAISVSITCNISVHYMQYQCPLHAISVSITYNISVH